MRHPRTRFERSRIATASASSGLPALAKMQTVRVSLLAAILASLAVLVPASAAGVGYISMENEVGRSRFRNIELYECTSPHDKRCAFDVAQRGIVWQ